MFELHSVPRRNRLLATLSEADLGLLHPHLQPVPLQQGQRLSSSNAEISHVYFIEEGVASVLAVTSRGRRVEVGLLGYEGMTGTALLLGVDATPEETEVQIGGGALCIRAADLLRACEASATLRCTLLRYVQALAVQMAHTSLAHGASVIEARLARWLLMCHDRLQRDDAAVTHDVLAALLGVRRSGVTNALHIIEGMLLVKATRGNIRIRDRAGLERLAGEAYGVPEAEYERLLAPGYGDAAAARRAGAGAVAWQSPGSAALGS